MFALPQRRELLGISTWAPAYPISTRREARGGLRRITCMCHVADLQRLQRAGIRTVRVLLWLLRAVP